MPLSDQPFLYYLHAHVSAGAPDEIFSQVFMPGREDSGLIRRSRSHYFWPISCARQTEDESNDRSDTRNV
jgi:hypothetical protein